MIDSTFKYQNKKLNEIIVSGHANYRKKGEDIVCAAVSTATIMTYNALEHLNLNDFVKCNVSDGYFQIKIIKQHETVLGIVKNLEHTLNQLEKQYPDYIINQKEE